MFGVVLGTAFLMATGTGDILRTRFADEEADRVASAHAAVNAVLALGTLDGRTLAVWVEVPGPRARGMLVEMQELSDVRLQVFMADPASSAMVGNRVPNRAASLTGASALIICNEGQNVARVLPPEVGALDERMVMDLAGLYDAAALAARDLHYHHMLGEHRATDLEGLAPVASTSAADPDGQRVWLIVISLLVSGIGIANALLMSVTERFREIGTLKCLGSPNTLVVQLFLIESGLLGLIGSLLGSILGWAVETTVASSRYGWNVVWSGLPWPSLVGFAGVSVGIIVAIVAALYPARVAARMVPADALRSDVWPSP